MIFNHVNTSRIVCTLPARSSLATSSPNSSICMNLSGSKSFDAFYRGLPVSERPVPGKRSSRKSELVLQSSGKAHPPFRIKSATLKECGATLTQCPGGFCCLLSERLFPGCIKKIHKSPDIRPSRVLTAAPNSPIPIHTRYTRAACVDLNLRSRVLSSRKADTQELILRERPLRSVKLTRQLRKANV